METFFRVERESTPQLVTIVGEPGVGKSRLVTELRATLDDRPELVTWRHGRCLPYGEGTTFWRALAEALLEGADATIRAHSGLGAVATARAILAETAGEVDAAAALYREAAVHWGNWGSVVERGYALLVVGRCAGDKSALREGAAIFERLRAAPFVARAV